MPPTERSPLQSDIAAALDWWREAGVDADYTLEAKRWLADPEAEEAATETRPVSDEVVPVALEPEIGGPRESWPTDLATFHRWWLSEPSLDEGGLAPRVAPRGEAGAKLMVLVAMPGEADREALLSGPAGSLVEGFLTAAGVADSVYVASVLPRHTTLADWQRTADLGMGKVLAHHVALARPQRLLILGRNILPLCGHDPAQPVSAVRFFNHEGGRVPAMAAEGPDRLLANWRSRATLWQRWLEWTDGAEWREGHG